MRRYGLLGRKLDHTFSPTFFAKKFEQELILDAQYETFELNGLDDFPRLLAKSPGLKGLNVTIPFKTEICAYIDELFGPAEVLQVVNTVVIEEVDEAFDGQKIPGYRLKGFNTDIYGFKESIKPLMRPWFERALILGTGASASSVAYVLYKLGVDTLFVSRNPEGEQEIGWEDINEHVIRFHPLIINTTPIGQFPDIDQAPELPYHLLTNQHLAYDLVYNPAETLFLKKAKEAGAMVHNGQSMLEIQASQSWKTWQNAEIK
jgi:shikimate dehydrogenase